MECDTRKNSQNCNCTAACSMHGKCCECVAYHRSLGQFPACFFSDKAEKTYDRSFSALQKDQSRLP